MESTPTRDAMMLKLAMFVAALLALLAGPVLADKLGDLSDRDLKYAASEVKEELRTHEDKLQKLERSGRSSSNTGRVTATDEIDEAMVDVVFVREEILSRDHTIMRHNTYTTTGTTDAAEVGTPMATKRTRRRVRSGTAEEHPDALRRLTRMQTILVTVQRLKVSAIEKQNDSFEKYVDLCHEFRSILDTELNVLLNEQTRRAKAAAAEADSN